ncbi:class A beta-lactamase [Sandaracinobacter sp. RS1-74]|uniref:class A beta-lactamase n=1 Tax=Sandaracinobacteroides sayramensis TaxID=2913411 RepID=UPI001EDAC98F|nr:class A beta-lactamase [Sandaracinobacteroides sayramensis]MCG2840648.1 class A beta-lactamase [Sandaracinobacteroides sayramensis]
MIERREFLAVSVALTAAMKAECGMAAPRQRFHAVERLRELETGAARLGVCFLDTATLEQSGNRMDEHFAMCSSFKLALVGACLREADAGRLNLAEILPYTQADLLTWSPITRENLREGGMSIAALAEAAQILSDGTAANLLVRRLGGPAGVTAKFRGMGDVVTRLDRYEPMLGMVLSADLRDTTTPLAMARLVGRLTTGDILSPASRQILLQWMVDTKTGPKRIRAGLPAGWRVGNKTGTGRDIGITNKCNDVAIIFPPHRAPVIISAYFDSGEFTDQVEDRHQAVLAEVGRIAAEWAMA